jgi:hypothetical protein
MPEAKKDLYAPSSEVLRAGCFEFLMEGNADARRWGEKVLTTLC